MIADHYAALSVVVPLLVAPVIAVIRRKETAWVLTVISAWLAFAMCLGMLQQVMTSGPITYEMGGWPPPWGIEYRIDAVNGLILTIVSGVGAMCSIYARASAAREVTPENIPLFYTMFLLVISGLMGIAATGDAFNAFVFLEISSLSTYALIAMGRGRRALMSSYQYLIMGTIGATFYLIGVGLLYQMTGSLNIADLANRVPDVQDSSPIIAGFAFITVGLFIKVALFPLHQWLPNAYAYAPSVVTALLAATATKVSIYLLMRITLTLFGAEYVFTEMPFETLMGILAVTGMFMGSLVAIFQRDAKRLLAYSSVAQVGYMLLGLSFASVTGLTAAIVHMANHAVIKSALFLALGVVFYRLASVDEEALHGLSRRMPFTAFAIVLGGLALIGVPLTAGFVSKWYLVTAALEKGWWPVTVAVLLSSLLAVIYMWRLVEVMYFKPMDDAHIKDRGAAVPLTMTVPLWVMTALCFVFGIYTDWTLGVAEAAAKALLSVSF